MSTPSLSSVSPNPVPADNNSHTMRLFGSNFVSGDTLTYVDPQGNVFANRTPTFVSSTELDHSFNDGNDPGTWKVEVNSPDGTLHSSFVFFSVATTQVTPSLSSVSPNPVSADNNNHTMQLFGSNFVSGDTLTYVDPQGNVFANRTPTFVSSTELDHSFNDGNDPGTWKVEVNSPDGTLHSSFVFFSVATTQVTPSLSSVSPNPVSADNNNHTMQLFGSNFVSGDTLTYVDPQGNVFANRTPTFVSSTELDHSFNDGNDPGSWKVEVNSPDGTLHSSFVFFTVAAAQVTPSLSSVSPNPVLADNNNHTMQLFGSNFVSGDTLTYVDPQGNVFANRVPTFVSSTELDHSFNDGNDPGTWKVEVNSASGNSSFVTFTVAAASGTIQIPLPFDSGGTPIAVTQQAGQGDHTGSLSTAYDFALPFGYQVRAVGVGKVVDIRETVPDGSASALPNSDGDNNPLNDDPSLGSGAIGNIVTIQYNPGAANEFYATYMHLENASVDVAIGDTVSAGEVIGLVGDTGARTGTHLHFQLGSTTTPFGSTDYGGWPNGTDNASPQTIANALSSYFGVVQFVGYGAILPSTVVGSNLPGAALTPSLSSVSPNPVAADNNNHAMQLFGSNFVSGDTLTYVDPQGNVFANRVPTFVSSTELDHSFNDGNDPGTWKVEVNSPDGARHSGTVSFLVAANRPPTVTPHDQAIAPGSSVALSSLFSFSDPDTGDSVVGFAVQDRSAGGGHLFLNGVQQPDNNVFGNSTFGIPIAQLSQWTFLAGPSGSVDQIGFNAIDSHGAYNSPGAIAAVTAAGITNQPPVITGASTVTFQTNQTIAGSQLYGSATDPDGSVSTIRFWDSTPGAGHFTLDGAQITGGFVDVAPNQIGRVAYVTGSNVGSNDIVVDAFDNLGRASNDLAIHINVVAPGSNQPPVVTGPNDLNFGANLTIPGSQLFAAATDTDGSVATIQFWDSTPGAGHFTLDGAPITTAHVDVTPSQLSRVAYVTGTVAGTNDIVIDAIDNLGRSSPDFSVHISVGGGGNQAPLISGPTHLALATNVQALSSQLITSASDPDGTIDHYTFSDSTPGDGFLTLDGSKITTPSVSVSGADLNRVGYRTGSLDGGTNTIAIQAFDALGKVSNLVEIVIDVQNSPAASTQHQFIPVDDAALSAAEQQKIAEFKSLNEDLSSDFLHMMATLSGDWKSVAQFVDANPDRVEKLLAENDTKVFFEETAQSSLLEKLSLAVDAGVAFKDVFEDIRDGKNTGQIVTDTALGANDLAISYGSGVIGAYVAGGVTAYAVGQTGGLLLPLAPLIFATTDFAVTYGTSKLLETAEKIVKDSWLDPAPPPWSYDPATGTFVSLQTTDPAAWQVTAARLSLDVNSSPVALSLVGDAGGVVRDDFLIGARGNDQVMGGGGDDVLFGLAGDDTLNGGAGADIMLGGAGNDIYFVDNIGDTVTENFGEGVDAVYSSISYVLPANVENLILVEGAGAINGTGNDLDNWIIGNSNNNQVDGGAGDDTYTYTGGFDFFSGGGGTDTLDLSRFGSAVSVNFDPAWTSADVWTRDAANLNSTGSWRSILDTSGVENVIGTVGDDQFYGDASNNTYTYTGGFDFFSGGGGTDTLDLSRFGSAVSVNFDPAWTSADVWTRDAANLNSTGSWRSILDTSGVENVIGTVGDDQFYGDASNNTYTYTGGFDFFSGGGGTDTLDLSRFGSAVSVNFDPAWTSADVWTRDAANLNSTGSWRSILDTSGVENVIGTVGDDQFYGDASNNTYTYTGGFDFFSGGGGTDTLDLSRFGSAVSVNFDPAWTSADVWTRDAANLNSTGSWRSILDTSGVENVIGTVGDDQFYGDASNNTYTYTGGFDFFSGGGGTDTLDLSRFGSAVSVNFDPAWTSADVWTRDAANLNSTGSWRSILDTSGVENVIGTVGDDQFYGDASNNTYTYTGGFDFFSGGGGTDTLDLSRFGSAVSVNFDPAWTSADVWTRDAANLNSTGSWRSILDTSGVENVIGTVGDDQFYGDASNNTYTYTGGFDFFSGGGGTDTLDLSRFGSAVSVNFDPAWTSADVWTRDAANLNSTGSWRSILDTSGVENVIGTVGDDQFDGDASNNTYTYTGGFDTVAGRGGSDTLDLSRLGSAALVNFEITSGPDTWTTDHSDLNTGAYRALADTTEMENVIGTAFNDQFVGDGSANTYTYTGGFDTVAGRGGSDTLDLSRLGSAALVNFEITSGPDTWTTDHSDLNTGAYRALADTTEMENVIGTAFNDQFVGDGSANTYTYTGGFDTVAGRGGSDTLDLSRLGSAALVNFEITSGPDTWTTDHSDLNTGAYRALADTTEMENVIGTAFNDQFVGDGSANTYTYTGGFDTVAGRGGSDTLDLSRLGSAALVNFEITSGPDTWTTDHSDLNTGAYRALADTTEMENVIGTAFNDQFVGDGSANTYTYTGGFDTVAGRGGSDTLDLSRLGSAALVNFEITSGPDTWTTDHSDLNTGAYRALADTTEMENVIGTAFNDQFVGDGSANTYTYTGGFDTVAGRGGSDTLDLSRLGSAALVNFEITSGPDTWTTDHSDLNTGAYRALADTTEMENVIGTAFNDQFVGDGSANTYTYTGGFDTVAGRGGSDTLDLSRLGSAALVNFEITSGPDTWTTDHSDLNTGAYRALADTTEMENVIGTAFNDQFVGDGSANTFTGGAGNDTFIFHPIGSNGDAVVDFTGNGAAAGDQLSFVGYGPGATFTQNDATHWQVNYNGGSSHDVITFLNAPSIHPSDWVFT